ncbi:MAG: winged helix-turn-helix domain-containing protein [Rhodothermales bacterium]
MPTDLDVPFYIGAWRVQPRQNRIQGPDATARIEPKMMEVLRCLATHPGEVVTRDELLAVAWAGTVVSDDVLTRAISELRKVFGDDPRRPTVIETIPKTGYRLLLPVTPDYRGDSMPPQVPPLDLVVPPTRPTAEALSRPERRRWAWVTGGVIALLTAIGGLMLSRWDSAPLTTYHPIPLTTFVGSESGPVFSPDGHQVAFTWTGSDDDNRDIYVKLVGSETPLRLTDDPGHDHNPAWSPDGTQVAFMRHDAEGCTIYRVAALGGPATKLASCGANIYGDLAWSPDGTWLAFNDKTAPADAFSLHLLSPTTLEKRRLTSPPSDTWGDHDPAFSPDGTHLSFTRSVSEGMQDVYTILVDGTSETRLTHDSRNIMGHAWTSDGERLVFASNRVGRMGLWQMPASGGSPAWLGLGDGQARFPDLSRQKNRLAYVHATGTTNIWQVPLDRTSTAAPLLASTRWDLHPQVSPDGTQIAFTSNRSGRYEIWRSDRDGRNAIQLTDFGGPFTSTPRWSPDGQALVFTARPNGQADLYRIDAEGSTPQPLTTAPSDEMAASWSPDGQWIYFSSNRSGTWEVWRMPTRGGEVELVTSDGGFGPVASPDGQWLYYTKHHTPGLWRMPRTGGSETQVLSTLDPRDWGSWVARDDGIIYVQRGRPTVIARHSLITSGTDTLYIPSQTIPTMDPAFTISPDGAWLLFAQQEQKASDLMLVEGFSFD